MSAVSRSGRAGMDPPGRFSFPGVALAHEWLVGWGGSEGVVDALAELFPEAPIHVAVHAPDPRVEAAFAGRRVVPTALQRVPGGGRRYPALLPLMPWAFGRVALPVDTRLLLSSSHAFAKAIPAPAGARHLCYCHTPPRYLWDLAGEYHRGLAGRLRRPLAERLREEDRRAARGVHSFAANSAHVAARILRAYGREARVIHPPVEVDRFPLAASAPGDYFVAGGRLVAYKRMAQAVEAANLGGFWLKVFGDGPERVRLERRAGPTVEFVGKVEHEALVALIAGSRGLLFPGEEDFGILPVEVQAVGRPVVAWGVGGALETVLPGRTGSFFEEPSARGVLQGIERLEREGWSAAECRANAERFSRGRFLREIRAWVEEEVGEGGERGGDPDRRGRARD